jgi:hypothetical protein
MVKDSIDGMMRAIRTNNLFEGERYFYKLVCSRSREQLKDIFEGFLQTYQHDITTVIHRHYTTGGPGSTRDYLDAIARLLRHGQTYFCNLIQATLKLPNSDQTKNRRLIFSIMSRTDVSEPRFSPSRTPYMCTYAALSSALLLPSGIGLLLCYWKCFLITHNSAQTLADGTERFGALDRITCVFAIVRVHPLLFAYLIMQFTLLIQFQVASAANSPSLPFCLLPLYSTRCGKSRASIASPATS